MNAAAGRRLVTLVICAPIVSALGVACSGESAPTAAECIKVVEESGQTTDECLPVAPDSATRRSRDADFQQADADHKPAASDK